MKKQTLILLIAAGILTLFIAGFLIYQNISHPLTIVSQTIPPTKLPGIIIP
jgi:hypothetical protein